jgi:hypothetical protein
VLLKDLTGFIQEKFEQMPVEKDPVLGNQTPGEWDDFYMREFISLNPPLTH